MIVDNKFGPASLGDYRMTLLPVGILDELPLNLPHISLRGPAISSQGPYFDRVDYVIFCLLSNVLSSITFLMYSISIVE